MGDPDPLYIDFLNNEELDAAQQYLDNQNTNLDEDDEEETEEEDEDEDEENDEDYDPEVVQSPRVSQTGPPISGQAGSIPEASRNWVGEEGDKRRRVEGGEISSSNGVESAECSLGSQWNRCEIEGVFCPICMEAWTNDGDHHICCLPCGHIYGMSCIRRWLKQRKSSGKCPQCNRRCSLKDVRKLFASRIVAVDEEAQKRILSLEAKCASLEKKGADWCKKEAEWRNREIELHLKVLQLTDRTAYLEGLLEDMQNKSSWVVNNGGAFQRKSISGQNFGSVCDFMLKKEFLVDGARLSAVDASNQVILVSRKQSGIGGTHVLTKISLLSPHEREDILLPYYTNAVRDLHISPVVSDLALLASQGKKLEVLSMESKSIILSYCLPDAAWSCSWDLNSSHYVYAGLKNGSLLVFDTRQTVGPLKNLRGLTSNPVHTIHSLPNNHALSSGILTASAFGVCRWNFDAAEEGPFLIPETENQGVCISLAYCPSSDDVVASYRPKVGILNEITFSQPSLTPSRAIGQIVEGSHVCFRRVRNNSYQKLGFAHASVEGIRLPKSTIIDIKGCNRLFVSGHEGMGELILQELPSFSVHQRLKLQRYPVRDVKYTCALGQGLLSCLTEGTLQLFGTKLS